MSKLKINTSKVMLLFGLAHNNVAYAVETYTETYYEDVKVTIVENKKQVEFINHNIFSFKQKTNIGVFPFKDQNNNINTSATDEFIKIIDTNPNYLKRFRIYNPTAISVLTDNNLYETTQDIIRIGNATGISYIISGNINYTGDLSLNIYRTFDGATMLTTSIQDSYNSSASDDIIKLFYDNKYPNYYFSNVITGYKTERKKKYRTKELRKTKANSSDEDLVRAYCYCLLLVLFMASLDK